jgi:TPR repeat protein
MEAFLMYERAAEAGDEYGIYNVATCYFNGCGVKKDFLKAYKLYVTSAEKECTYANRHLGLFHISGS